MNINDLVNQFYADCLQDSRTPNADNLRAWLWFVCPASLRAGVGPAIQADARWTTTQEDRTESLRIRLSPDEKRTLQRRAAEEGVSVSELVRQWIRENQP